MTRSGTVGPGIDATLLEFLGIGFAAGALGTLLGVGGGVILVPGLLLVDGMEFRNAVGASLVCVVGTSVAGSIVFLRRRLTELPLATELQFFTVSGAVGAGLLAVHIPTAPLYLAFAALLVFVSIRMWRGPHAEHPGHVQPGSVHHGRAQAASVGSGVMSGLLGIGGGVLNVPVLHLLLGRSFMQAVPISVYMVGITAAAGASIYLVRGDVLADTIAGTMLGTLGGARIAALIGERVNQRILKTVFALLLLYTAVRMGSRGFAQF